MLRKIKNQISRTFPLAVSTLLDYRHKRKMSGLTSTKTPQGFLFAGNQLMQNGLFEPEETSLFIKMIESCDVVVDIGANIGYYTCLARSYGKYVVAFEPLSENLDLLFANLDSNGWMDTEVFPIGLADGSGLAVLYGGDTGASLVEGWAEANPARRTVIPLSSLDTVIQDRFAGKRVLVKIDVEGAELGVLRGAEKLLSIEPAATWLVEVCLDEHHPDGINPDFRDVFELFFGHGYQAYKVGSEDIVTMSMVEKWLKEPVEGHNFVFKKD